jgi:glycosyltransferase involved in cell wall biosynthesis
MRKNIAIKTENTSKTFKIPHKKISSLWGFLNAKKNVLISVILASYNHADFIEEAAGSVLNQNIESLELIVVDDGSTDGTPEKLEKIKDPRIKLIRLKENRRFHPRNVALGVAKGKYIAFQNSDDVWRPGKLQKQLNALEENENLSACFTDVEIIDETGRELFDSWANGVFTNENRSSEKWLRYFFDKANCLCISSAVVRQKKLKQVGEFNPSLIQLSDFDLWVRLAAVGEFQILEEKLTAMRIVGERNVSNSSSPNFRRFAAEYAEVLERFSKSPAVEKIPEAFGDILPKGEKTKNIALAALAKYAWTLSPSHVMFANKIMSDIMKNDEAQKEVVKIFGTEIIHEFIKKRGQIELKSHA